MLTLHISRPNNVFASDGAGEGSAGGGRPSYSSESAAGRKYRLEKMYNQGKRILEGRVPLRPAIPGLYNTQLRELELLKNSIPQNVQEARMLRPLAGRLSNEQLESIRHYLDTRYPKPKPKTKKRIGPLNPL